MIYFLAVLCISWQNNETYFMLGPHIGDTLLTRKALEQFGPCREKNEEKPTAIILMAELFCSEKLIIFYTEVIHKRCFKKKKGSIRTSLLLCICWQTFIFHRNKYLLSPNVLMLLRNISLTSFLETAAAFYVDYKTNLFKLSVFVLESSYFCTLLTLL